MGRNSHSVFYFTILITGLVVVGCRKSSGEGGTAAEGEDQPAQAAAADQAPIAAPAPVSASLPHSASGEDSESGFRAVQVVDSVVEVESYAQILDYCGEKAKAETLRPAGTIVRTKDRRSYGICTGALVHEGLYAAIALPSVKLPTDLPTSLALTKLKVAMFTYMADVKGENGVAAPQLQIGLVTLRVFKDGTTEAWGTACTTYPRGGASFNGGTAIDVTAEGHAAFDEHGLCPISKDAFFSDTTTEDPTQVVLSLPRDAGQTTVTLESLNP